MLSPHQPYDFDLSGAAFPRPRGSPAQCCSGLRIFEQRSCAGKWLRTASVLVVARVQHKRSPLIKPVLDCERVEDCIGAAATSAPKPDPATIAKRDGNTFFNALLLRPITNHEDHHETNGFFIAQYCTALGKSRARAKSASPIRPQQQRRKQLGTEEFERACRRTK
jgi:hypothetical protein